MTRRSTTALAASKLMYKQKFKEHRILTTGQWTEEDEKEFEDKCKRIERNALIKAIISIIPLAIVLITLVIAAAK